MALTKDNHAFVHGTDTTVPGSWLHDKPTCRTRRCRELAATWKDSKTRGVSWDERKRQECKTCEAERRRRCRVVATTSDKQLYQKKFLVAPLIVPHNDIKYDVNKKRARHFAEIEHQMVFWAQAKDDVSLDALRDNPSLPMHKKTWLQRHDRDCGALYGMLPLVHRMPVALTDHVDRNPRVNLLRGRVGRILGWVLPEARAKDVPLRNGPDVFLARLPLVVLVEFPV
jgi:hypothetical protein